LIRDLEVYQEATKLSALIFSLQIPKKYQSEELSAELSTLRENSKLIIKFIVESYNDKFNDFKVADKKLEIAAQTINLIIAKLDFLSAFIEDAEFRNLLSDILKKY